MVRGPYHSIRHGAVRPKWNLRAWWTGHSVQTKGSGIIPESPATGNLLSFLNHRDPVYSHPECPERLIAVQGALQGLPGGGGDAGVEGLFEHMSPEDSGDLIARWRSEEPLLFGYQALTLLDLDRLDEAREAVEQALALDPDCEPALEARGRTP